MVVANLSLCSGCHLLTYCKSVGSELSSRGFWRYLYLMRHHLRLCLREGRSHLPPDQLVEDIDELLYLIGLGGGLDLKEGEGRCGSLCVKVQATGLEKAADEKDVKEGVRIFEEFQGRSRLDELICDCVVVSWGNSF
jgi:hypothetical protein